MLDQSAEMFNKWPFTSVHMWGERPQGTWILEIKNNAKNTTYINLNLILYGTKESPQKRGVLCLTA
jgi:subtilisin-like proprotein convertase family protein